MSWPFNKPEPLHAHEYLRKLQVPGMSRTFVVGSFARYQTLHAQQIRAINLIDSLHRSDCIQRDELILVVGGGIAGMMAAIAARHCGARVMLLEESDQLIPFQRHSKGRFLHPQIYDWPFVDASIQLPFMNWAADTSENVFRSLQERFEELVTSLGNISILHSKRVLNVEDDKESSSVKVTFLDVTPDDRKKPEDRDESDRDYVRTVEGKVAILAIGFGRELRFRDIPGYWDGDGFTSIETRSLSWLVSGHGDGALTDLIRLLVKEFDHARIVTKVTENSKFTEDLKSQLLHFQTVRQAFDQISSSTRAGLLSELGERRHDTKVTFCAPRNDYLESADSCILNRLLVFLLEDRLQFREGQISTIPMFDRAAAHPYKVELIRRPDSGQETTESLEFDGIIPRHGVESIVDPEDRMSKIPKIWSKSNGLINIWKRCADQRADWRVGSKFDDRTRTPTFLSIPFDGDRSSKGDLLPRNRDPATLHFLVVSSSLQPSVGSRPLEELVPDTIEAYKRQIRAALQLDRRLELKNHIQHVRCDHEWSASKFQQTVRQLCRADIVFFDTTDYQPLVMVLLGIRSAVKNGINITCTHDKLDADFWSRLPFNIKELFPLGIGADVSKPNLILGKMLSEAIRRNRDLPDYQDLPSFHAIRRTGLSARYPREISYKEEILWLCSYHSAYTDSSNAQTVREKIQAEFGGDVVFLRATEIVTPELASHKLFDAIRRYELCVIDWTQWSSNIFFEFGVRLATNPVAPVCLISDQPEPAWRPKAKATKLAKRRYEEQSQQVKWLAAAFAAIPYSVKTRWNALEIKDRIQSMKARHGATDMARAPVFGMFRFDLIYTLIAEEIGHEITIELKSPEKSLKESVARLVGDGSNTTPGIPAIYSDRNAEYNKLVRRAALEHMVAAWRYALGEQKLVASPSDETRQACDDLAHWIKNFLNGWDEQDLRKQQLLSELAREGVI